jgi:hypothetical protein
MNRDSRTLNRRGFLQGSALAFLGASLGLRGQAAKPGKRAKVVLIRDPKVLLPDGKVDVAVMARMLDEAICALLGTKTAEEAWKKLFNPKDKAGIKSNVYTYLRTPVEVEQLLKKRIAACGIPDSAIPVTDREARTLLADRTALVNVRPVRTHHWSGIGGCLKNPIMFVETPSDYHEDSCSPLGAIWLLPILKGKVRLNILLALRPLFYGRGPHAFDPRFQWNYAGLFMSTDPVAVDALGAELLRLKRIQHFGEDRPVTPTKHIQVADTKYGLGVSDLSRIDLIKLGSKEDLLLP